MCIQYKVLYDYEWNLDGTVARLNSNSRCQIGMDMNISAARLSRSLPNNLDPYQLRDDQGDLLIFTRSNMKKKNVHIYSS